MINSLSNANAASFFPRTAKNHTKQIDYLLSDLSANCHIEDVEPSVVYGSDRGHTAYVNDFLKAYKVFFHCAYCPLFLLLHSLGNSATILLSGALVPFGLILCIFPYIWGAFFSSCGNQGTRTHSTQPALQAVSCTDIASGAGGHRYGFCQMGAAALAKDGYPAADILCYYYSNSDTEFCRLV